VEPENRVVARELERRWNAHLAELETLKKEADAKVEAQRPLTEAEVERARRLGDDLEGVWQNATTSPRDRKRLLRTLVEEVQLRTDEDTYRVRILWKGGALTDCEVVRKRMRAAHATPEDTIDLIRRLAIEFDDAQIARVLNKQGRRSGYGNTFTKVAVRMVRRRNAIPICKQKRARDPRDGPFTADETARELGVSMSTVHRWLRDGVLPGRQMTVGAPWQILLTDEVRRRLTGGDAPVGWVGLTEAARRLGTNKAQVAHLVKTGKLEAVRAQVGKRQCWRIDVESADCGAQASLFDTPKT
jgi:DNA-binding transcriptional regulator YiaG